MRLIPDELIQLALHGYLVVCANNRQLMELKKELEPHVESRENFYPKISTIDSWAEYQFRRHFESFQIITKYQTTSLLEQIIALTAQDFEISNIPATAKVAATAITQIQSHRCSTDELTADTLETEAFIKWYEMFLLHCEKRNFVTLEEAKWNIVEKFENPDFHISKRIVLYGFHKKTPNEEALIACFENHTSNITHLNELNLRIQAPLKAECNDINEEISRCVGFIKQQQQINPDATICVTSPILSDIREQLTYKLLCEFGSLLQPLDSICHSSFGDPLFDIPEIQALLLTIDYEQGATLSNKDNDYIELSKSFKEPLPERSGEIFKISEDTLFESGFHCEILQEHITYYRWCTSDDSRLEQIRAKLEELLEIISTGDVTNRPISHKDFMFKLKELLQSTPFKLRNNYTHKLFVFGIYETIGLNFDHIWVIGANGNYWPNRIKPNPMISKHVADRYQLVLKDEKETTFFKELTSRLINSCYELYYSYSKYCEDRELLNPSFFSSEHSIFFDPVETSFLPENKVKTERVDDTYIQEMSFGDNCPRGTQYIKNFNLCPFKAHYSSRYSAVKEDMADSFLESKAHGDLVHHTLEQIGKELTTSKQINAKTSDELFKIVRNATVIAINAYKTDSKLPNWFFDNEVHRITSLVMSFMELEKLRNYEVESIERKVKLTIGGLKFTLFIDRIEKESIQSGDTSEVLRIVSDHKTGRENASEWFKSPCPEPQIPIYTMVKDVDGALYNIIRDDEVAYKGFVRDGHGVKMGLSNRPKRVEWKSQLDQWHTELEQSAVGIREGYSKPLPLNTKACEYCNLTRVCRVNEAT